MWDLGNIHCRTIVSREVKPGKTAIVTVGYIQVRAKNNIFPDQAELGLTIRAYKPEVRKQLLAAIARITKAEAEAAGAPRTPLIEHYESTNVLRNDPVLAARLKRTLQSALGESNIKAAVPGPASEDFSYFIEQGIPSSFFGLGAADPQSCSGSREVSNCPQITPSFFSLPTRARRFGQGSPRRS